MISKVRDIIRFSNVTALCRSYDFRNVFVNKRTLIRMYARKSVYLWLGVVIQTVQHTQSFAI